MVGGKIAGTPGADSVVACLFSGRYKEVVPTLVETCSNKWSGPHAIVQVPNFFGGGSHQRHIKGALVETHPSGNPNRTPSEHPNPHYTLKTGGARAKTPKWEHIGCSQPQPYGHELHLRGKNGLGFASSNHFGRFSIGIPRQESCPLQLYVLAANLNRVP